MARHERFPAYGIVGMLVILLGYCLRLDILRPLLPYLTPIMWTGYILLADALLAKKGAPSFIKRYGSRFFDLCLFSVAFWLIFEGYNLLLQNWYYINLPGNFFLREWGYLWSFATILPGVLVTAELVRLFLPLNHLCRKSIKFTRRGLAGWCVAGTLMMLGPLVFPSPYLFAPVWLGVIFAVDPINYWLGKPSLFKDVEQGDWRNFWSVPVAGYVCGFLWEFWNYWAFTKWIYTVPFFSNIRIFEMPVLGFLGFGPFALECYVATNLVFGNVRADRLCHG